MKDWIKNLISYNYSKDAGKCPKCNKGNVEVMEHVHGNRKSYTFTCKDCEATMHFDGIATK